MNDDDLVAGLFVRDDDEDIFSRDIDGQLVRLDAPTASDYQREIQLQIDGQAVTVPSTEPLKDAQGNIVLDIEGRTTPRYTTIYDAARTLYVKQPGDKVKIPIPTLCHMEHMKPVGVCRLCVVQIYGEKRGKCAAERKLLPACQIPVKQGMEVFTALGHLELARLSRADFLEIIRRHPVVRRRLIELSFSRLKSETAHADVLGEYVDQGLYEAQSVLVLDLDRCTRCDECTRGCVQQHGGETHGLLLPRLLREGARFGNFLVATSCRSCTDAHCMVGCPVDSIHRGAHQQIVIEDHCIGCGFCAKNCPYGSIFMAPNLHAGSEFSAGRSAGVMAIGQPKAATCDLCQNHGDTRAPAPQCVASCPHDAAFRFTGNELLRRVLEQQR